MKQPNKGKKFYVADKNGVHSESILTNEDKIRFNAINHKHNAFKSHKKAVERANEIKWYKKNLGKNI